MHDCMGAAQHAWRSDEHVIKTQTMNLFKAFVLTHVFIVLSPDLIRLEMYKPKAAFIVCFFFQDNRLD